MSVLVASPTGSASPSGSEESPYTLSAATAAANPGDTVLLRGEFKGSVVSITKSGLPGAPITFATHIDGASIDGEFIWPKSGANALIQTAPDKTTANYSPLINIQANDIVWAVNAKNSLGRGVVVIGKRVVLKDFEVNWTRGGAINVMDSFDIKILNVRWLHSGSYYQAIRDPNLHNWAVACYIQRTDGILVDGCLGQQCWGEGFAFGRGTRNGVAVGNTMIDCMSVGMYGDRAVNCQFLTNTIYCTGLVPNVPRAEGLTFRNEDYKDATPPMTNVIAVGNLIVGCKKNLALGRSEKPTENMTDVLISRNTFVEAEETAIFANADRHRNVTLTDNLIYQTNGKLVNVGGIQPGQYHVSHNGWGGVDTVVLPPGFASASDILGVKLVNPLAMVDYSSFRRANYAPIADYGVGAVDFIPEPPVIVPNEAVRLVLEGSMSPASALIFRELLASGEFSLKEE